MTYNPTYLAQHARALAAAFGIRLVEDASLKPEDAAAVTANVPTMEPITAVICAPIIDETTYAVVLHEIGHHIAPLGNLRREWSAASKAARRPLTVRDYDLEVESEEAAWTYARHHALVWTDPMQFVQDFALGTYTRGRAAFIAQQMAAERASRAQVAAFATRVQWHA